MLKVGDQLPPFELQNQEGLIRRNSDYTGKWLILYVYPKDDTPGCTLQGQSFSAMKDRFAQAGAQIVGVSADDVESHKNFCRKYSLAVELLADPDARLLNALGVGQSEYKGMKYWDRTTFIVDPAGVIRRVYEKVNPQGHEQDLIQALDKLQSDPSLATT